MALFLVTAFTAMLFFEELYYSCLFQCLHQLQNPEKSDKVTRRHEGMQMRYANEDLELPLHVVSTK